MIKNKKNNSFLILIISGALITIAMTPWVNVDSLIIPKEIILFCTASYFLPLILSEYKFILTHKRLKILSLLSILIFIQMILVMTFTSAPLVQQIFGSTGRGLGFLTELSLLVLMIVAARFIKFNQIGLILKAIVIVSTCSSMYSILQKFGLDLFAWSSRTNGIIGTLGNPNFQSSLAAITIVPVISYLHSKKTSTRFIAIIFCLILIYTIYICQSTQGYLVTAITVSIYLLIYTWYRKRSIFIGMLIATVFSGAVSILGMLNSGPLSILLYKNSIKSRGEFWRSAFSASKDNPIFGVGIDSFGDVSNRYKSASDASGINEFTNNTHNYFLHYSSTGGLPLVILNILLIVLTFVCFFKLQNKLKQFNHQIAALFTILVGFQAQSMISPGTISLMVWNAIISGSIIGLSTYGLDGSDINLHVKSNFLKLFCFFSLLISLFIIYPLYNSDRLQLKSLNTKDALLAIKSAKSYPESSQRYSQIGVELLKSGLLEQSLDVARSATKFNPNSISAWAMILANNSAPLDERRQAKQEILRIDPFNIEIKKIVL